MQWCPASRQCDQPRQHETGSNGVCEATARRQHVRARPRQTRPAQGLPSPQQLQASGQLQSKVKLFMNFLGNVGYYCTSIMPERRSRTAIFPLILTPQKPKKFLKVLKVLKPKITDVCVSMIAFKFFDRFPPHFALS